MNYQLSLLSLMVCSLFIIVSCSESDDEGGTNNNNATCTSAWSTAVQDELNAVSTTSQAYALDNQNTAKCNAYKDALQNYVDALEELDNCPEITGQIRVQWQETLDQAEDDLNSISC